MVFLKAEDGRRDADVTGVQTCALPICGKKWRGRARASATFFHHDYRDQITYAVLDYTTFQGTYVNLGRTQARGLELAVEARPAGGLAVSGNYTFLYGKITKSGITFEPVYAERQALLRRPRHQGTLSLHLWEGRVIGVATSAAFGRRADSD